MTTEGLVLLFAWLEYAALVALLAWLVLRRAPRQVNRAGPEGARAAVPDHRPTAAPLPTARFSLVVPL